MSKEKWLEQGYAQFAVGGPASLKVEPLAARTGISKSSFYHHFADLEVFEEQLCQLHLRRAAWLAERERAASSIDPDLVDILVAYKTDLLFSRQLRMNRQRQLFENTLQLSNKIVGTDFIALWARELRLSLNEAQLQVIFGLALENFYLQMQPEQLGAHWLRAHFRQLKQQLQLLNKA